MKSFALVACCAASLGSAFAAQLSAEKPDAMQAQQQLSMIMAASTASMAQAENQQKRAIRKAKKQVKQLFATESKALAAEMASYDRDLQASADGLMKAAADARVAMKKVPVPPSDPTKWDNSDVEQRAVLSMKLSALESESRRLGRKRTYDLSEATSKAKTIFEYAGDDLSRKLGDLSSLAETAQAAFDNIAPAASPVEVAAASNKVASLAQLGTDAAAAKKQYNAQFAVAEKRFADAYAKASSRMTDATTKLAKEMDGEVAKELKDMHVQSQGKATHLRAHRKAPHQQAAVAAPHKEAAAAPLKKAAAHEKVQAVAAHKK